MTSISQLKKEVEIVRRALRVDSEEEKHLEEDLKLLREYAEAVEYATRHMTPEEKGKFHHEQAKQLAKDYAEGRI